MASCAAGTRGGPYRNQAHWQVLQTSHDSDEPTRGGTQGVALDGRYPGSDVGKGGCLRAPSMRDDVSPDSVEAEDSIFFSGAVRQDRPLCSFIPGFVIARVCRIQRSGATCGQLCEHQHGIRSCTPMIPRFAMAVLA